MPRIYIYLMLQSGHHLAIMEKLEPRKRSKELGYYPPLPASIAIKLEEKAPDHCAEDIHDENIMRRKFQPVVTDPWSHYSDAE